MSAGGHWPDTCRCHCGVAALEWFSLRASCTPQPCGCYLTGVPIPAPWQASLPDPWEEKPPPCGSSTFGIPREIFKCWEQDEHPWCRVPSCPLCCQPRQPALCSPCSLSVPLPISARRLQGAVRKLKASKCCHAPNPGKLWSPACWEGGKLPPLPAWLHPPPWFSLPGGEAGLVCFP